MILKQALPVILLAFSVLVPSSHAATVLFSYETEFAGQLSGTFSGSLLPDNNTFVVTGAGPFSLDGSLLPPVNFIFSPDNKFLEVFSVPTISLDGTFMDVAACNDEGCNEGFFFNRNNLLATLFGGPIIRATQNYGDFTEEYLPGSLTVTPAAVPEPATTTLVLTALLAVAVTRARR